MVRKFKSQKFNPENSIYQYCYC